MIWLYTSADVGTHSNAHIKLWCANPQKRIYIPAILCYSPALHSHTKLHKELYTDSESHTHAHLHTRTHIHIHVDTLSFSSLSTYIVYGRDLKPLDCHERILSLSNIHALMEIELSPNSSSVPVIEFSSSKFSLEAITIDRKFELAIHVCFLMEHQKRPYLSL